MFEHNSAADRGISNSSYMMVLLSLGLAEWAKNHSLNIGASKLMFVTQIESDNLDDVYLSLVYDNGVKEQTIHAGYVGQKMSDKERQFSKKLPLFTLRDLERKPPFDVIMKCHSSINDTTGIVKAVAGCYHQLMKDTCILTSGVTANLATLGGSAILFMRDQEEYTTKFEFYLKDINKFIKEIEEERTNSIRHIVKNLMSRDKQ